MAPKGKKPQPKAKPSKAPVVEPEPEPEAVKEYATIAEQLEGEYQASRPFQVLREKKGIVNLTAKQKEAYALATFLEAGVYETWPAEQQTQFWKAVDEHNIPTPLVKPEPLGLDSHGVDLDTYTPAQYAAYLAKRDELLRLQRQSDWFRQKTLTAQIYENFKAPGEDAIRVEKERRQKMATLEGKPLGRYGGDPAWDDVVPIPQDDGEGALAAIAYTDDYKEAMGYLRAVMAAKDHSPRVLELTDHVISMNAAHYTVWLYRAEIIMKNSMSIPDELNWVNEVALDNQKNYQIWHHRQTLIDELYPTLDKAGIAALVESEVAFMTEMFEEDSKNYHVWSYRQYFVRRFSLFNAAERESIEELLRQDVCNNSAWSHRFFIVFSDPAYATPGSSPLKRDAKVPAAIIDREIGFAQAATREAPQNPSPWNYLRGVLRKGGRPLQSLEAFACEFVSIPEGPAEGVLPTGETVRSSHALDYLADMWAECGERPQADRALRLLGERYDRVRKNYWEWRRRMLTEGEVAGGN